MKIRSRWLIRGLARMLAWGSRSLFATVRVDIYTTQPQMSPYEDPGENRYLYCLWHDAILAGVFSGRWVKLAGLASRHADGAWVADAMEAVGITAIRGSSRRGGAAAVRQMIDAAKDVNIAIATDGPRGPRRVVKEGIVYLASQTGRPIVPTALGAVNAWRPRGKWTDLVVPKPFSQAYYLGGPLIYIPPGLSREQLKDYRDKVQEAMDSLNADAERLAAGEPVDLTGWIHSCNRDRPTVTPERPRRRAA